MQIEELVSKVYSQLSENDLYIWKFISKNKSLCTQISIDELAKRCHVSRTSVLRFAKRLGLSGFSELKIMLKMQSNNGKDFSQTIDLMNDNYTKYIEYLKNRDWMKMISLIEAGTHVYVYGRGTIQKNVVDEIYRSFLHLGKVVSRITTEGETDPYEYNIKSEDTVILVSKHGVSDETQGFVRKLKMKGTKTIAICTMKENPLLHMVDEGIYINPMQFHSDVFGNYLGMSEYFIFLNVFFIKYLAYLEEQGGQHNEY